MPSNNNIDLAEIRKAHEARWNETNGRYPQYAGKLETAVLVRVKRKVSTKGGLAFLAGQYALAWKWEPWDETDPVQDGWTCHSMQLGWNVLLRAANVVVVG